MNGSQKQPIPKLRVGPDAIAVTILKARLEQIADEMDAVLVRSAISPVISEAKDRAHGIYDRSGKTIAQGPGGMPIFIGSMEFAVGQVANRPVRDGDVFILNDPYVVGTHLQDVKIIKPVFVGGKLTVFVGSTAHWIDIGGRRAGGWTPDAHQIFEEGLRIPPLRIMTGGQIVEDVLELILGNVRMPDAVEADLKAQIAALEVGERRVASIIEEKSRDAFLAGIADIERRSARLAESTLRSLNDGDYETMELLDNDGVTDEELIIRLVLRVKGGRLSFDFTGSSPPCVGPMNVARPTVIAACFAAVKHAFPKLPINAGGFSGIDAIVPDDCFLNAEWPRPVGGYTEAAQRIIDAVLEVLRQAGAAEVGAGNFSTSCALTLSGHDLQGHYFVALFNMSGGYGASRGADGLSGANAPMGHAHMIPVEVYEARYPVTFEWFRLREGSAGAGQWRGGLGTDYAFRIDAKDAEFSVMGDHVKERVRGVEGGEPSPMTTAVIVTRSGQEWRPALGAKASGVRVQQGDIVNLASPGGGGFGPVALRDPALLERDCRCGYVQPSSTPESRE